MKTTGLINIVPSSKITDNLEVIRNDDINDYRILSVKVIWKLSYEITDSSLEVMYGNIEIALVKVSVFNNATGDTTYEDIDISDFSKDVVIDGCKIFTIQSLYINFQTKTITANI